MNNIDWEDVEALKSIANQSIYNGREVGRARAALQAIHGYDIIYNDELDDYIEVEKEKHKKGIF
ncbi:MAG: hypothetical protein V4677_17170 [Bacteroidota bacterium]